MLISVMMKFVTPIMTFIMNMRIMPVNESAEGAAVLPGAAHVGHMDTRVALQYHNINITISPG